MAGKRVYRVAVWTGPSGKAVGVVDFTTQDGGLAVTDFFYPTRLQLERLAGSLVKSNEGLFYPNQAGSAGWTWWR